MSAPSVLARVGALIYGDGWPSPMSRAISVNVRTLQRCRAAAASGDDYPPAEGALTALYDLVDEASEMLKEA